MEEERAAFVGVRQRLRPISTKTTGSADVDLADAVAAAEDQPLSPGARMFHEKDFNIHVLAIMGTKTKIHIPTLMAKFPSTLLKHPRFSSIVVGDASKGDQLKWVRVNASPDDHIVVPQIELEADADYGDKYLEDYIYNLSKTSLDRSKPLWDLHVLNVRSSQAEATGVLRVHHSLGDGTSLMSLLLACTRQTADPTALPTIPKARRSSAASSRARLWWSLRPLLAAAYVLLQLSWNTMVDIIAFFATSLFLKDTITPLKGGPGVEYTPRRVVFRTVSLDDFKLIKNAVHGTINDAALAITQAGLSTYLNRKYGSRDETKNNLPKNMRLRSTLLINLRPTAGIQALSDMMEKNTEAKWGNWIGFVLLPFTIGLRDDPMDYIREAKATVDRKKRSLEALYTFTISEIALKLFGVKVSGAMSHRVIAHTTMCFSNLVGPMEEIEFYGHPIQFLAPSSYGQPHALMINFQSYVDKMTIVLSVDEDVIPDARQLCDDIVESLRVIKEAVVAKGLA